MSDPTNETAVMAPSPPAAPKPWAGPVLAALLVLGSPALVAGAFFAGFLDSAEQRLIQENPLVKKGFNGEALRQLARPAEALRDGGGYAPLSQLTLGLQARVDSRRAWPFRLVNLLFHFGSGLLLYLVLLALFPRSPAHCVARDSINTDLPFQSSGHVVAALGVAFFFLHPANVESVAWVTQRPNVQGLFLALLAWWLMVSQAEPKVEWRMLALPVPRRFLLALVVYAAALLSSPAALGFAPLLVLTELVWVEGPWQDRLTRAAGFVAVAIAVVLLAANPTTAGASSAAGGGWAAGALTAFTLIGRYAWHVLAPGGLSFCYAVPPVESAAEPWLWWTVLLVGGAALILAWLPLGSRALAVLLPGAVLALGPALAPGRAAPLQDHGSYFALAPAAGLLALALDALHYRLRFLAAAWGHRLERAGFVAAIAACFTLGVLAQDRSYAFPDAKTLYEDAVTRQPESYQAHYLLARELAGEANAPGLPEARARELWEEAGDQVAAMGAGADQARFAATAEREILEGEVACRLGLPGAEQKIIAAATSHGKPPLAVSAKAEQLLAEKAWEQGRPAECLTHVEKALWLFPIGAPELGVVRLLRAKALKGLGRHEEAAEAFQLVGREHPELARQAGQALNEPNAPGPNAPPPNAPAPQPRE